jgi:hypothetical protein
MSAVLPISFANWFINHIHLSGFIADQHFDSIISRLNNQAFDDFLLSQNYSSIAKSTADVLIPLLVQNMPPRSKISNQPNTPDSPHIDDSLLSDSIESKKAPKKRAKKPVQHNIADSLLAECADAETLKEPESKEPETLKEPESKEPETKKAPKKRAKKLPQQNITDSLLAECSDTETKEPETKKEPKKRSKKPVQHNIADSLLADSIESKDTETKKEPQKRAKKQSQHNISDSIHSTDTNVEVVIPTQEQLHFIQSHELTEDIILNDDLSIELTETFIDNVLFYTNSHGLWFDYSLQPITCPL